ncbi:MAG: AMP-binding protein [Oscillospiraceae bacterium]|nr:AMP-binding protein [Oscillospiraceae bacterium]
MFLDIDKKPAAAIAAIDDSGERVTYGELAGAACYVSGLLPPRELVFCLCENRAGALAGYIALYQNKDVPLLLDAAADKELLRLLMELYGPSYLWLPERMAGEFPVEAVGSYKGFVLAKTPYNAPKMHDGLSFLLSTSGSTGTPKLVRHRYGNLEANARAVAGIFGWDARERGICHLPIQYTMGLNVINSHLYAGAAVLLTKSSLTSSAFWDFISEQKGTNFTGVPYSYEILFKLRFMKRELPYLRTLASGGGKLPEDRFAALAEYAAGTGRRFFSTFGTTETSARMAFLPPEMAMLKVGSIGRAIPGGELWLLDDSGSVIGNTEAEGELCCSGPNVTMGYANSRGDLSRGDELNGVYHTGDIARRDRDGCYYIIGRRQRFLKLFGHRVSLEQCEMLIGAEFASDCACIGSDPCAGSGERMKIFLTDQSIAEQVRAFLSEKTGLPRSVFSVSALDEIPRNQSGKIDYPELKELNT